MLPPGRRRGGALSPMMMCLALVFLFTATANAAGSVLGLDFGTLNLKAALIKPGIPLEIVPTKDSKRKEAAAVAFKPTRDSKNNIIAELGSFPERAYGSDALALQGRFPGEVFPNLKPLLGLPTSSAAQGTVKAYRDRYPAVQAEQIKEMGTIMFKSSAFHEGEMPWNVEELLAMELTNIRKNAEALAGKGASIEDAVVTVPVFYTADEKRAIKRAAQLAGLEVNALISDGLAVGVDYAKSRTFPEVTKGEKPEYHLVYDMGAGSSTATLLRFQSRSVKDVGKFNKTVQEVAVVGTGWDRTLGGDSLTNAVLNDYVGKFVMKAGSKAIGVKENGRAMARLWKEAERARQVLSANNEVHSSFEELLPDVDFKTKLNRAEFENICVNYAERVVGPINDALATAKLTFDDVESIILHGGAVRTPLVQKKLEKIAGGSSKLRSNVNADESAVFGAAFKGAGLSPSFKVKEIRDSDSAAYAIGMSYTDGEKARKQQLFASTSPVGSGAATKQVTFKDKDDFTFGFYQKIGEVEYPITQIRTSNLTDGVKALKEKFGCEKEEITTKFSVKLSSIDGLPDVLGGTVSCEVEGSGKKESIGDSVKDWFGFGKKDQEALKEGEEDEGPTEAVEADAASSSQTASGSANSSSTATESSAPAKLTKRTESIPIKFEWSPQGNPQPGYEEIKRMRDRLVAFERSDKARYAREEALNVLESYTYFVRDFLSNEDYAAVSTEKQRSEISKLLDSTRSFMEDSSKVAKAQEEELREKLQGLKGLVTPIQTRRTEEANRPAMVDRLKESLNQTNQLVDMIQEQVKEAEQRQSKAKEFSSTATSEPSDSSTTASPSASNDLDDLEEPDASSTPSSPEEDAPKYSDPSDFNLYTSVDLTEISTAYGKAKSWLEEKEAQQAKLGPHEEPVLLVGEIERRADELGRVMRDLLYKKMKAEEKPKTKKASKTSKAKSKGKKTKATSSGSATDSVAGDGTESPAVPPVEESGAPAESEVSQMAPALPDVDSLEELGRKLRVAQTKWNQHLLFIAVETSCDLSISVKDPKTPLHDALANLCREAKVIDLRIQWLQQIGSPNLDREESERCCSVQHLLRLIDEPLGAETASARVRRAVVKLEFEVRDVLSHLAYLENGVSEKLEDLRIAVDQVTAVELEHPTRRLVDTIRGAKKRRDALKRDLEEGAVWTRAQDYLVERYDRFLARNDKMLQGREMFWAVTLSRAAEVGVDMGRRQALITEFFDYEGGEDESEDEIVHESDDAHEDEDVDEDVEELEDVEAA